MKLFAPIESMRERLDIRLASPAPRFSLGKFGLLPKDIDDLGRRLANADQLYHDFHRAVNVSEKGFVCGA